MQKGTANGVGTRHPQRHRFESERELRVGKIIVLVGNDARVEGAGKPSDSEKCHLNQCERKERPLASFQC